jgi:hypothetical protein
MKKKKKNTTFPQAGTRRKRVAAIKKKEDNQDEDFDDLMCEEEPLIGKRRRKGTGKASNTTRSRSGKISKISLFFCICLLLCFLLLFFSLFEFKNFQNRSSVFEYTQRRTRRVYLKILTPRDIFFSSTQINHLYHQFHRKMTTRKERTTISTTRRR